MCNTYSEPYCIYCKIVAPLSHFVEDSKSLICKDCYNNRLEAIKSRININKKRIIGGIKHDQEKPRMALVLGGFSNALTEVAKVGTFGAKKYADNNWKSLKDGKERTLDAALRHIFQYLRGEEIDEEMQLPHLAAAIWELCAAYEFSIKEDNNAIKPETNIN